METRFKINRSIKFLIVSHLLSFRSHIHIHIFPTIRLNFQFFPNYPRGTNIQPQIHTNTHNKKESNQIKRNSNINKIKGDNQIEIINVPMSNRYILTLILAQNMTPMSSCLNKTSNLTPGMISSKIHDESDKNLFLFV